MDNNSLTKRTELAIIAKQKLNRIKIECMKGDISRIIYAIINIANAKLRFGGGGGTIWINEHESKLIKFITMFPDKK